MTDQPIITFDYDFSPYNQKIRFVLAGSNISFQRSDQPIVLPRPILEKLDITYRRIPVLAIGKDVYADSSLIIDEIQSRFNTLPTTTAEQSLRTIRHRDLRLGFENRPCHRSDARFNIIENEFLSKSSFVAGDRFGLADIHVGWAVSWSLEKLGLGQEPGFSHQDHPRIHQWLSSWPKPNFKDIGEEDVKELLLDSGYSAKDIGVDEKDYLGIKQGTEVTVENSDTKPGAHPQKGKLVGLNQRETIVELKNGLRLHFPRIGYVVKEAKVAGLVSRFGLG